MLHQGLPSHNSAIFIFHYIAYDYHRLSVTDGNADGSVNDFRQHTALNNDHLVHRQESIGLESDILHHDRRTAGSLQIAVAYNEIMNRSIRYFESQEIVRRRYHRLHGRYPNAAKARSIALHVEQGVNFIESASRAPISIRPLLQFYGVAASARAVTIFRDLSSVESTLTPGHGLQVPNWDVLGDSHPGRGFTNLNVRITAGLFSDLSRATDGLAQFYANSSRPNWAIRLDPVATGTEFNFADLLGLLPDLWEEHSVWTGANHARFILHGLTTPLAGSPDQLTWTIGTQEAPDETRSLFPNETVDVSAVPGNDVRLLTSTDPHFQPVQLHHGPFDIGDTQLVPPIGAQVSLSTVEIYYATAYVMSMLARYRLSDWLAVWRGEKGDIARPVFERAMDLIQEQHLQVCSDLMEADTAITL